MRCPCHASSPLSEPACRALDLLSEWVTEHGTVNLSQRLVNGDAKAQRIYNQCQHHFGTRRGVKQSRPPDLEGLSALAVACHLAGIDYTPGALRSTTYEDDLKQLLDMYDAGRELNESALVNSTDRKLFYRAKKRAGKTWFGVFTNLRALRPDIDFRRFFASSPEGVYVDHRGRITCCENDEEIAAFAVKAFAEYSSEHTEITSICRLLGEGPHEIANLYWRLLTRKMDVHGILERATGRKFPNYAVLGRKSTPTHMLAGAPHPEVGSNSELLVDTAMAQCVPDYSNIHRHQVALTELIPGLDFDGAPYNGRKSPIIDMLIAGKLAIEVSFSTERLKKNYALKMAWKLARLKEAGFDALNVKIQDGAVACASVLRASLERIGLQCDEEAMREVLWAAEFCPGECEIPVGTGGGLAP